MRSGKVVIKADSTPKRPAGPKPQVLVVVHHDGYLEIFANPRNAVSVRVEYVLDTEEERLAEDYLRAKLPPAWKEVFLPGSKITSGLVKDCLTPDQEEERRWMLSVINWLLDWRKTKDGKQ